MQIKTHYHGEWIIPEKGAESEFYCTHCINIGAGVFRMYVEENFEAPRYGSFICPTCRGPYSAITKEEVQTQIEIKEMYLENLKKTFYK